jgi:endonuclease YncB( thermonuclease family)
MRPLRFPRHSLAFAAIALLIASMAVAYRPDDWSRYDHRTLRVTGVIGGDSLRIQPASGKPDTVKLPDIDGLDSAKIWLSANAVGRDVTLLLQLPQTRDASGQLRTFVFLDGQNLSVELVKAGLAYADRREKTEMDGLIDAAEAEARKKKRGVWANLKFDQMPQWRQEWLKSRPKFIPD